MTQSIQHRADEQCFYYEENGAQAYLEYTLTQKVMRIEHTWVPPELRGHGVAAALTHRALNMARDLHLQVHPVCTYAARFIEKNPEFQALLVK